VDARLPPRHLVVFGRLVRRERRARDLSQVAFAHAAGLSPKHVSEIERAKSDLRFSTLLRIARGLGLSPGVLLTLFDAQLAAARER